MLLMLNARAQTQSYSVNLTQGLNLIANQLDHGSNTVYEIMPYVPDGSVLYKFDNNTLSWVTAVYSASLHNWAPATVTLNPGEGAFFQAPTNWDLTFTGTPHVPVLPVTVPPVTTYLLSRQTNDIGNYTNIIGTAPTAKTKIFQWSTATQTYTTAVFTFVGWNMNPPVGPTTAVGQSYWITAPGGGTTGPQPLPTNASSIFQGLLNQAFGSAAISVSGNQLIVTNLGSSGQDGVGIALPSDVVGLDVLWNDLDPSNSLPVGAFLQQQVVGVLSGTSSIGTLATMTTTKEGTSNYVITADFSGIGATNFTVDAYLQGALVAQATGASGGQVTTTAKPKPSGGLQITCCPLKITLSGDISSAAGASSTTSSFGGGAPVAWDTVVVTPIGAAAVSSLTAYQLAASQIPGFTIDTENVSLVYQGLTNTTRGIAADSVFHGLTNRYGVASPILHFLNFGSSGQDGVSIGLPTNLVALDLGWDDLDPSNALPTGAYLQQQVIGPLPGSAFNGVLGTMTTTKAGTSNYVITADFTATGASNFTVQAYLQGVLVAQATGQNGGAITTTARPKPSGGIQITCCPLKISLTGDIGGAAGASSTTSSFGGGAPVAWDTVVVTPIGGSVGGTPTAYQLTASQIPSIGMETENASFVYQGLTNTSTGHATLAYSGSEEIVTNLGSGGQDGLSISLPTNIVGLDLGWDDLDPSDALPVGAFLQQQVIGPLPGSAFNGVLGTVTTTKQGNSNYVVTADFTPTGATEYTAQAYLGGALVSETTAGNGAPLTTVAKPGGTGGLKITCCPFQISLTIDIGGGGGTGSSSALSSFGGGAPVAWDTLVLTPIGGSMGGAPTAYQLTASQIPNINIETESPSLVYQGLTNTGTHHGSLAAIDSQLFVSNLNSGGQDGVSIALPTNIVALDLGWEDLDPNDSLPTGAYLQQQLIGPLPGSSLNGVLGTVTTTKAGSSNYVVAADFTPTGAGSYTAQAYLEGGLVAQTTSSNGAPVTTIAKAGGTGGLKISCCPFQCSLTIDIGKGGGSTSSDSTVSSFGGGAPVAWDTLVLTPIGGSMGGAPTAYQLTASQIPNITIDTENASLVYQGLTNTGIHHATLTASGTDLIVTNLGSGGQDGVSITWPNGSQALDLQIDEFDGENTLPVGAYLQESTIGTANGTYGVLGSATVTKAGTNGYTYTADFSPLGVSNCLVQAYLAGQLVGQATNNGGGGGGGIIIVTSQFGPFSTDYETTNGAFTWDFTFGISANLAGGPSVTCDQLFISPIGGTSYTPVAYQLTGSQVPSVVIHGETFGSSAAGFVYQGLTNTGTGHATLTASGSELYVTNLGSTGQDGVSVAFAGSQTGLDIHFEPLDPSNSLPVGSYIQDQVIGTANGINNGVLGTVRVTKEGTSNYMIMPDFSPLGVASYTVQAYLQGSLVAQATEPSGTGLSIPIDPFSVDYENGSWTIDWLFGPIPIGTIGGQTVSFDQLYLTPLNVDLTGAATSFQLTASQIPNINITDENVDLVYQGLTNTGTHHATLAASETNLVITNLGSSGQDGVSIALPTNIVALDLGWEDLDPSNSLPTGAYLQQQVVGPLPGSSQNGVLGTVTTTKAGTSNYVVTADFTPTGAGSYTAQAYLGGGLVAQTISSNGAPLTTIAKGGGTGGLKISCCPFQISLTIDIGKGGGSTSSDSTLSSFGGGAPVSWDTLVMTPIGGSTGGAPTAYQLTASQIPGITIDTEDASFVYQGLTNTGNHHGAIAASGTQLVITNLGSSGQDGVSIALSSNMVGLEFNWQDLDVSNSLPVGAYIQEQAIGASNGANNVVLGTLTAQKSGVGNYSIYGDFSPMGASTFTARAYSQGVQVGQSVGQAGTIIASSGTFPRPDYDIVCCPIVMALSMHWPNSTSVTMADGSTVTCDHLYVSPNNVSLPSLPSALNITASQIPSINIDTENVSLVYHGITNTSLSAAALGASADVLYVTNLGSGGQDGVSIALPGGSSAWGVEWQDPDALNTLPVGAYEQMEVVGTAGSVVNGVLGTFTTTKEGTSNYVTSVDFSPLGVTNMTLQVYNGGTPVGSPQNLGNGIAMGGPKITGSISITFKPFKITLDIGTSAGSVTIANGPTLTGNNFVFTPVGLPTTGVNATSIQLQASQIPALTITQETPQPAAYDGLQQTALGTATLNINAAANELYVTNLGSGGQDGVGFTLPTTASSWGAQWQPLDPGGTVLPVGAYLTANIIGPIGPLTNRPPPPPIQWGTITVAKLGNGTNSVTPDFSASGASNYQALAYNGTTLVAQTTGQNGVSVATIGIFPVDLELSCCPFTWKLTWHNGATALTMNGVTVTADSLQLVPQGADLNFPTEVDLLASQVPAITLTQETASPVIYNGVTNTPTGVAILALNPAANALYVTNLNSGGQDGVTVTLPAGINAFEAQWEDLDPGNTLPAGAYLQEQVFGSGGSATNGLLGLAQVTKLGTNGCAITADFSSVGASTETVRVYAGSTLVAQAGGQSGQLCTFPRLSLDGGYGFVHGTFTITFTLHISGTLTPITLPGQAPVMGDRIEVQPDVGGASGGGVALSPTSETFLASGIPQIVITNEVTSVLYGGMMHSTLGNAILSVGSTTGDLYVTNLGSGGQDGLSFALPNTSEWAAEWQDPDAAGTVPVGAFEQMQLIGTAGNVTNGVLATITSTKDSVSNYVTSVDFSPLGATGMTLQANSNSTPVGLPQNLDNGIAMIGPLFHLSITITHNPFSITIDFGPGPIQMNVANGASLTGNNVTFTPSSVPDSGVTTTSLKLQASQIPGLTFTQETVLPVVVTPTVSGSQVSIQWFGTGVLQQSSDLINWSDMPGATSPFNPPLSAAKKFYRVREPLPY